MSLLETFIKLWKPRLLDVTRCAHSADGSATKSTMVMSSRIESIDARRVIRFKDLEETDTS
jgi:hypothetical protein